MFKIKVFIYALSIIITCSCKQKQVSEKRNNLVSNQLKEENYEVKTNNSKEKRGVISNKIKTQSEVINNNNYEEKLEKIEFKKNELPSKLKSNFCEPEVLPEFYTLFRNESFFVLINKDICGDFLTISINSINNDNELIDDLIIGSEWYEPDNEEEYKKALSFAINDYEIKLKDEIIEYGKITSLKSNFYLISSTGEFVKTKKEVGNKNTFTVGGVVYSQVETYLNVRATPNTNGDIIAKAYPEDELKVLEILESWVKIELNGKQGYVSKDFVK